MKNPYDIMNLQPSASDSEIKITYRRLAQEWHPDRGNGDAEKFQDLQWAYSILRDPKKRKQWDETGAFREEVSGDDLAMAHVMSGFQQWLNAVLAGNEPVNGDCIGKIGDAMQKGLGSIQDALTKMVLDMSKLDRMIDRFERKGFDSDENPMVGHLLATKVQIQTAQQKASHDEKIMIRAIELLADFTYNPDEGLVPPRNQVTGTTGSTSTVYWNL